MVGHGAVVLSADLGFQIALLTVGSRFPYSVPISASVVLLRRRCRSRRGVAAGVNGVGT